MKVQADLPDRVYKGLLSTLLPSFEEADAQTFHEIRSHFRYWRV